MPKNFKPKQGSGDTGLTDIITGKKIRKTDSRIKAIAAIDELTCLLGLLKARFKKSSALKPFAGELEKIQKNLFIVSGIIAGMKCLTEIKTETANLEELTNVLSNIKKFYYSRKIGNGSFD
jgi:cob(I)alamin adenosyltransferase